jgi:DNA-binding response OmpR family regulator
MAGCRVLVVEDEPDIVTVVRLVLEAAGHTTDAAGSLAEARARLARIPGPQVVIVDRRLPDGDGLDLVRAIRTTRREVPVLVLSAVVSAEAFVAARESGATLVMTKPFEPDALEVAVHDLCRQAPIDGVAALPP